MSDGFREPVSAFVKRAFRGHDLADDEDIFAAGFVNSLFAMELITFLEAEFDIVIGNDDLDLDNFSTVNRLTQLIERKREMAA